MPCATGCRGKQIQIRQIGRTVKHIVIIGAGPAGLIAADRLSAQGLRVTIHERMPSIGRKLLMAGRGGLNLTHSEPADAFMTRYADGAEKLRPAIEAFSPADLRNWADELGQETFVGTSGRVFPKSLKASPLLRALIARIAAKGVEIITRAEWQGWDADGALLIAHEDGRIEKMKPDATLLALGGASWPKLGSTGTWVKRLEEKGVRVTPLSPANCGFDVSWSDIFRTRFSGEPLKHAAFTFAGQTVRGEAVITDYGLEGGAIYALSAPLRRSLQQHGKATLTIDLSLERDPDFLIARIEKQSRGSSLSNVLRKAVGLSPAAIGLMREAGPDLPHDPKALAKRIKAVPVTLTGIQPITRAISSAGGVAWDETDQHFMLKKLPGVFVAGEMLDWEAPTGGYLLQAVFATGLAAAEGIETFIRSDS